MAGPYKSEVEACEAAPPCGFTAFDERTNTYSSPPKSPDCSTLAASGASYTARDLEIHVATVACAEPRGLRGESSRYHAFLRRADGWWRSPPLFELGFNGKYCDGAIQVRWNERPGHTFAGVAVTRRCLECDKHGEAEDTLELMLRFERGGAGPLAYGPLVVGERTSVEPTPGLATPEDHCTPHKEHVSMAEKWGGDDDLELAGPATWRELRSTDDGVLQAGFGASDAKPSTRGRYHFVH
jgi:hypothetical protein